MLLSIWPTNTTNYHLQGQPSLCKPAGVIGELTQEKVAWTTKIPKQHRVNETAPSHSISTLVVEYKLAKARLEMTLAESRTPIVRDSAPTLAAGKILTQAAAVLDANDQN